MNKNNWAIIIVSFLVITLSVYIYQREQKEKDDLTNPPVVVNETPTSTDATTTSTTPPAATPPAVTPSPLPPAPATPPATTVLPYGKVTLKLGQSAKFKDLSIELVRIYDDSRCPEGVTCIWAGTVKAELAIVSAMGKSTTSVELDKTITTESEMISLLSVTPYPKQGGIITSGQYQATFEVTKRASSSTPPPAPLASCYTGGCSGEVCSDRPDMASNCIYRAEFACYKTAKCERQASGACGWTKTTELNACLANPPAMQ